jgi:hypothetical protein
LGKRLVRNLGNMVSSANMTWDLLFYSSNSLLLQLCSSKHVIPLLLVIVERSDENSAITWHLAPFSRYVFLLL